jgi:hypothetical protein
MSRSSLAKAMREMIGEAERQGFRVEDKTDGWMVYGREVADGMVMVHKTPSKQGTVRTVRSQLRRLGVELRGR